MKNIIYVNANEIDMSHAYGMGSEHFWDHHGNTKETYMKLAQHIPAVQSLLDEGHTVAELMQHPDLQDTVRAYFFTPNMVCVKQRADRSISYIDDGRHRIRAAAEFGYTIPVCVTELEAPTVIEGNIWLHTNTVELGLRGFKREVGILVPASWVNDAIRHGLSSVENIVSLAMRADVIMATSNRRISNRLGRIRNARK